MIKLILVLILSLLVGCQGTSDTNVASDAGEKSSYQADSKEQQMTQENEDSEKSSDSSIEGEDEKKEVSEDAPESKETDENEEPTSDIAVTPDNAVDFVKGHVQGDYMTDLSYFYDGESEDGKYRVQVYEVVTIEDGDSHTATYGWYLVDPETGEVTNLFDE